MRSSERAISLRQTGRDLSRLMLMMTNDATLHLHLFHKNREIINLCRLIETFQNRRKYLNCLTMTPHFLEKKDLFNMGPELTVPDQIEPIPHVR